MLTDLQGAFVGSFTFRCFCFTLKMNLFVHYLSTLQKHQNQFTGQSHSACESSCINSNVALEKITLID